MGTVFANQQFLYTQHWQMNSFGPTNNMYYQFWMLPNMYAPQAPYFPPMTFYPQMAGTVPNNILFQTIPQNPSFVLPISQKKNEQKSYQKTINCESLSKQESVKVTVQSQTNNSKEVIKINQTKKANRPQTYLTEKAFYMKQKLKVKQINSTRTLRRRLKFRRQKINKFAQHENIMKSQAHNLVQNKKRLPIQKGSDKQRKLVQKIKLKLQQQILSQYATTPKIISGISNLNQFCRTKYESLMSRRISQC